MVYVNEAKNLKTSFLVIKKLLRQDILLCSTIYDTYLIFNKEFCFKLVLVRILYNFEPQIRISKRATNIMQKQKAALLQIINIKVDKEKKLRVIRAITDFRTKLHVQELIRQKFWNFLLKIQKNKSIEKTHHGKYWNLGNFHQFLTIDRKARLVKRQTHFSDFLWMFLCSYKKFPVYMSKNRKKSIELTPHENFENFWTTKFQL